MFDSNFKIKNNIVTFMTEAGNTYQLEPNPD